MALFDSSGLSKAMSMTLLLPLSTVIGYAMGNGLDTLFHTGWLRYIFLGLGTAAGLIEIIRESGTDK
jgi:F0F1-type ATP synthase assembly protein I